MRAILDRFYAITLWLAAACLVLIALLVGAQVIGRIFDSTLKLFGYPPYGFLVASLAEIGGFLLAAASFLALAGTLKRGAHIRLTLLFGVASARGRHWLNVWALAAASVFAAFICWNLVSLVYDSIRFNEVSYGILPIPLAIPQSVMTFGAIALLIALLDELSITLKTGTPSFSASEEAINVSKET
jgi:TRAP-type C4-dicarboxylate transport system permease small subunit